MFLNLINNKRYINVSSVCSQNRNLCSQLLSFVLTDCVYKIAKCIHKMSNFCINLIYENEKNEKGYVITAFVLTTPTQHIHYFWGDNN